MPSILYVTGTVFYPQAAGGVELATYQLLCGLQALGWKVTVIASERSTALTTLLNSPFKHLVNRALSNFTQRSLKLSTSEVGGLRVWKADGWHAAYRNCFYTALNRVRPDVLLTADYGGAIGNLRFVRLARNAGVPSCIYVHCSSWLTGLRRPPTNVPLIANSEFTARTLRSRGGSVCGVVNPLFAPRQTFNIPLDERPFVTFINPIADKGVRLALEVARLLPRQQFLFVQGKWDTNGTREIDCEIKNCSNVILWPFQDDMALVWRATKLLLLPSTVTETFGRVIIEAQSAGVPVVARDAGAIRETVGKGGVVLGRAIPAVDYAAVISGLVSSPVALAGLSIQAKLNARRSQFDPEGQLRAMDTILKSVASNVADPMFP